MYSIFSVSCIKYFILVQAIGLNVVLVASTTLYNNDTNFESSWKSSRSKRSVFSRMPDLLIINVQYAGENINLKWVKKTQYLANEHLPIITPLLYPNTNVMKEHGEFVMYQDAARCSAVVYFRKSHSFYGSIGTNYYVTNLPYRFDYNGNYPEVVGEPYVMRREYRPVHDYPTKIIPIFNDGNVHQNLPGPSNYAQTQSSTRQSDSYSGPSTKRQRTDGNLDVDKNRKLANTNNIKSGNIRKYPTQKFVETYYLEIIVFVTRDIVDIFKERFGEDQYIEKIINYYITYFNGIDMMFQMLYVPYVNFRINIAKIEFEDEIDPFTFMTDIDVEFDQVIKKMPQYLRTFSSAYTPDSFDYVFISTNRPILHKSVHVPGATKYGMDLYDARAQNTFYDNVPITVVGFQEDYIIAVQEISRSMNIGIDSPLKGLTCGTQCYSVMQKGSSRCDKCLKWSPENIKQFKVFFRENRNRCFFSNFPRSLLSPGQTILVRPQRQCKCYGYDSHYTTATGARRGNVRTNGCSKNLICQKIVGIRLHQERTVQPFDGTPCAARKVCWERECVKDTSQQPLPQL